MVIFFPLSFFFAAKTSCRFRYETNLAMIGRLFRLFPKLFPSAATSCRVFGPSLCDLSISSAAKSTLRFVLHVSTIKSSVFSSRLSSIPKNTRQFLREYCSISSICSSARRNPGGVTFPPSLSFFPGLRRYPYSYVVFQR